MTRRPRESISAAELFAEEADEFAALGRGDGAPVEVGDVGLGDGLAGVFGGDGRDLRDDFAGDGGAYGEIARGGVGHAKVGEDGFDFLFDGHGLSGWFLEAKRRWFGLRVASWRVGSPLPHIDV